MFGLLKPPQQGPPLGKAQAPMAAHCQSAFAEFLASWAAGLRWHVQGMLELDDGYDWELQRVELNRGPA